LLFQRDGIAAGATVVFAARARRPEFDGRPNGRKIKTAAEAAVRISSQARVYYFLSSPKGGGAVVTVGGFAGGAGFGGVGVFVCMPSLKLRIPSPSPRMTSGIFFPPKRRTIIARTINQ